MNQTQHPIQKTFFERTFTLADKVEIQDAEMMNGMLKIWLENMVKVQDAVKKITIKEKEDKWLN